MCLCIYYFILIDFPSTRQAIIHNHTHTSAKKTRRKRGEGGGLCHFGIPFRRGGKGGGELVAGGKGADTHAGRNDFPPDTHNKQTQAEGDRRPASSRGEARPPHKSGYHKGAGGKAPACAPS